MISDFSFESPVAFEKGEALPGPAVKDDCALRLPIAVPDELLRLDGVAQTIDGVIRHFSPLRLTWTVELDVPRGGARASAVLQKDDLTGAVWLLGVLQTAGTGLHSHNEGGPYGECVITLAGEMDDVLDDGTPVRLERGAVMFHAPNTIHEATSSRYWVGLYHQPRGCTLMI